MVFARGGQEEYRFRFDRISRGDVTSVVMATGTVNPVTSVNVGTQVSGTISRLYADFNSVVKKGQVIAQIDSTFLYQSVKDAEASLEKAQSQFQLSKTNYVRERDLFKRGLDSQQNYDAAQTSFESDSASLKSADAALDRAKINLAYSTIRAPISGVVIDRPVNVGQTVAASFSSPTLYTIANDLSKMQVLATIDESDIGDVSIGQKATFTVDAYPDDVFRGTVSQIRLAPISIQNVVNYNVVIDVKNEQLKLMPGMTATISIIVQSDRNVLRVPTLALRFQPPADAIDTSAAGSRPNARRGTGGGRSGSRSGPSPISHQSSEAPAPQATPLPTLRVPERGEEYGLSVRFPEFEKSPYVPVTPSDPARLWVLDSTSKKLKPIAVHTGISDGRYTEVVGPGLNDGEQIVLGASSASEGGYSANPFTPQGPGGRFGRFR
jgi:HlyD family secretion protein